MISDSISARVRDLRRREGISRAELAERARAAGAPATFTAVVVGNLETGRVKQGARTRDWAVSELLWVAQALEVTPLELLDDAAAEFLGASEGCGRCAGEAGDLERQTRASLESLAQLEQLEPALAATALRLARAADQADTDHLPRLTKELRAALEQLAAGRRGRQQPDDDDEDEFGDLDEPDGGAGEVDLAGLDASVLDEPAAEAPDDAGDELRP